MRIWSLHPKYLDRSGLLGLWRESLLAKNVLMGLTKGYKNHSQLVRFKSTCNPIGYIETYLYYVYEEAKIRGYNFNKDKIGYIIKGKIIVTKGQLEFEKMHLNNKLTKRNSIGRTYFLDGIEPHPLFSVISGGIEVWEKL